MMHGAVRHILCAMAVCCVAGMAGALLFAMPTVRTGTAGHPLSMATSSLFAASGQCEFCHSTDGDVLLDSQRNDLSPPANWRATMMANAFKDPFFHATLEREVALYPEKQVEFEDSCLTCHAPMARTQAKYDGHPHLTMAMAESMPLAHDGVSCTACHQVRPDNIGTPESWNGGYIISDAREIFGPFEDVFQFPMQSTVGFTPMFGAHKQDSGMCATCHTLFTPIVDAEGIVVGQFPEQVPYLEWLNSDYPAMEPVKSCQQCHMPVSPDEIVISSFPPGPARSPFFEHHFVGGNAFMLGLLKNNIDELQLTASSDQFDMVIDRTLTQLREKTVRLEIDESGEQASLGRVRLRLVNMAGHKFPTGYPSRRAWLRFTARDAEGTVLFQSGQWNTAGEIPGLSAPFELHHETIADPADVQVYESIVADIDGDVTTSLHAAAAYLKDNRIPPQGYRTDGPHAGDTAIVGGAALDADFNRAGSTEGTGSDAVAYEFSTASAQGDVTVTVDLVFQSVQPRFVDPFRTAGGPKAAAFIGMYDAESNQPVVMVSRQFKLGGGQATGWMLY